MDKKKTTNELMRGFHFNGIKCKKLSTFLSNFTTYESVVPEKNRDLALAKLALEAWELLKDSHST